MSHSLQRAALLIAAVLVIVGCDNGSALVDSTDFDVASKAGRNPIVASVTGSGHAWIEKNGQEPYWRTFTLTARAFSDGSVQGHFQYNSHPGLTRAAGTIECLTVLGNSALIKAAVNQFDDPHHVAPDYMWFIIEDGEPDLFTPGLPDGYLPTDGCSLTATIEGDGGPFLPLEPVDAGGFEVRNY